MSGLNKALSILDFIASQNKPVAPKAIASALSLPLSTVYRMLHILKMWEFVAYSQVYGAYTVGAHYLKTDGKYQQSALLRHLLHEPLMNLAKNCGETVAIITANFRETICVDMVESVHTLRCSFEIGRGNTLLRGASAKTWLAFATQQQRDEVLSSLAEQERQILLKDWQQIVQNGFGVSVGEIDAGVLGISAPLFRHQELLAVLSLMAPEFRVREVQARLIDLVCQTAQQMSDLLSGR